MADNDNKENRPLPAPESGNAKPLIVAIGASAGGIHALQEFFDGLPPHTGAAFVVIVHLDPEHRSEMPSILAARTKMPVVQVGDRDRLQADHVYVIPPDRRLQMVDHEVSALEFDEPRGRRAPIDLFFRSLAERLDDGFAVILSGAGSDGALGVRAVKEAGGIILVQEPAEAEYSSMPYSAIATGVADFVLPARELGRRVADLIQVKESVSGPDLQNFDEEHLLDVLSHLRARTGHDFSKYKRSTVLRRIARRMQVVRVDDLTEYYRVLRDSRDEAEALLGDLLISVTTFFRDAEAFNELAKDVIPHLFEGEGNVDEPIRAWICGCATGEEAYSFAILLLEEAARHPPRRPIQVFGSDLDSRALALAREGRFPAAIEADVSEERLRRFFIKEGYHYRMRQEVRDIVLFAVHDLLKDPPFSHVDLISCRNVLIYLDRDLQEQLCNTFHYALNPGGYLFLGSSENAENPPSLFRVIDRTSRIYQSTSTTADKPRLVSRLIGPVRVREPMSLPGRVMSPTVALGEAAMHRRAIEATAPPSMLVDESHRVIHLSDNAGRYVMPAGGPLSGDAVDLVRPELRFELRSALNRAFERQAPTLSTPIPVRFNGAAHRVHLLVRPAHDGKAEPRLAVVIFIEGEAVDESLGASDGQPDDGIARRLRQELELTQARLRTVREESDAANEELRAANEELQSINEEYRSTSEELETSKEELQSINEELQTVNSELKLKLDAISRAHSDLQNLLAATDVGTLFLDSSLRIKRFTDQVTELFSINASDNGRPITDFANQLEYPDLVKDVRGVLANLVPTRREVRSRADRWYDVRMRPYRTVDDKIDGVVITFVDVTERRHVDSALRQRDEQLRQDQRLVELSRDPIFIWDFDDGILFWNRGSEELYGFSRAEAIGKRKEQVLRTEVPGSSFAELRAKLLADGSWSGEVKHCTKDGRELTIETRIVLETLGGKRLALESTRDVTERKQWERRQQLLLGELAHRVRNTLAVVQAIAHQSLRTTASSREFVERFDGRLSALAAAHTLLVNSDWHGADLATLAQSQLDAHRSDNPARVEAGGDPVTLPADLATPFGLILHELATNAAKHGALSRPTGRVSLRWTLNSGNNPRVLKVVWREQGGPLVQEPTTNGFGSALIESGLPSATVKRDFNPAGLVCTIELPLPKPGENGTVGTG